MIQDILIEARAFEAARKKRISENRSAAVKAVWQRETLANVQRKEALKVRCQLGALEPRTEKQLSALALIQKRPKTGKQLVHLAKARALAQGLPRTEKQLAALAVTNKLPRTEKQLAASRKNWSKGLSAARTVARKLPRTEKQLATARETIKLASEAARKLPRTKRQLESFRKAQDARWDLSKKVA